jgi:hypothetical protein
MEERTENKTDTTDIKMLIETGDDQIMLTKLKIQCIHLLTYQHSCKNKLNILILLNLLNKL